MNKPITYSAITFGVGTVALVGCQTTASKEKVVAMTDSRPNVVVIFTDDQGYSDVGCFGAKGFETPNLDRMASEGVKFTNFHVAQAVCSASRAGLLTGCYPNRIGISGALFPRSDYGLNPNEVTIADMLKEQGYRTGMFGKWHLGHHKNLLPPNHGFDEYFGTPYSNDMWPVKRKTFPPLPLIEGTEKVGEVKTYKDQNQLTTIFTERATAFIKKNKEKPFFLYLTHPMPHVPLGVSDKFRGKSKQGMYGDVIMELDWSVGEILKTIKDAGIDENTVVVFTSDNGPWLNYGNHGGSCYGLREGKGTSWEGGKRVPCIVRWPSKIAAGSQCDKLASTIDLLPTFAEMAGGKLPDHKIDGVNILPLLAGDETANPRDYFFYYYGKNQLQAVTDGRWKLVFPHRYRTYEGKRPGKDGRGGPVGQNRAKYALYDLKNNLAETEDVKNKYPTIVAKLEKLAEVARADLGDALQKRPGTNIRPPGQKE